jgi:hypothetical protein
MANTLKFGNGQWATKVGSTLAYNDENDNFKSLPFNFTRSTGGTRVNKDGLIEVITNNKPRIDFLNDSNGALLLEPSRTNLITYSEDFSNAYWTKTNSSITSNVAISPDGTLNADKLVESTSASEKLIQRVLSVTTSTIYTASVFVKYAGREWIRFTDAQSSNRIHFNTLTGAFGTITGTIIDYNSIAFSNGWYKLSITTTSVATAYALRVSLAEADNDVSYTGNGTSGVYIWGAQFEQGSYATSYIPTQGAISTKVAESCSQTPPVGVIGQTEGVIYLQVGLINNNNSTNATKWFMEIRKDANNSFGIGSGGADVAPTIRFVTKISGVASTDAEPAGFSNSKIAIQYTSSNFKIYQNGSLKATINKNIGNYSEIEFMQGAAVDLKMPIKDFRVYNTVLTDAELIALTT